MTAATGVRVTLAPAAVARYPGLFLSVGQAGTVVCVVGCECSVVVEHPWARIRLTEAEIVRRPRSAA